MAGPAEERADRGVVATPVHCRRCGYNLFGLRAEGSCPECGLEIWETILHTVDPAASGLPKLHNPRAVGNALLWLLGCMVVAALLLVVRPVALWLDAMDPSGVRNVAALAPEALALAAGAVALAGLWSVWQLAPPRDAESGGAVWRGVWLLGCGLLGWAVLAVVVAWLEMTSALQWVVSATRFALVAAAVVALLGLRGVLGTIGLRSRSYRTARGGRQGIQAMIAAIAGNAAGQVINALAAPPGGGRHLEVLGTAVIAISTIMLLVGLAYLVVNVWWIRRSLLRPPPAWSQILRRQGDAP